PSPLPLEEGRDCGRGGATPRRGGRPATESGRAAGSPAGTSSLPPVGGGYPGGGRGGGPAWSRARLLAGPAPGVARAADADRRRRPHRPFGRPTARGDRGVLRRAAAAPGVRD